MQNVKKYYFVGIGGSGMSALAQVMRDRGSWVGGSDRRYTAGSKEPLFKKLARQGIVLFPQHNSVPTDVDTVVVSTAIEHDNPQLVQARNHNIPVVHRAKLLSGLFNASHGIGIAGTSGKSTVTGMVASILDAGGCNATVINGGIIKRYATERNVGNARNGTATTCVCEVDESDGTIVSFKPRHAVITNIARDHKDMPVLQDLFQRFADNTAESLLLNGDCRFSMRLRADRAATFGLKGRHAFGAEQVCQTAWGSRFVHAGVPFEVRVPGIHNVYNALAAIGASAACGVGLEQMQEGLVSFTGIARRLDLVGKKKGITVIDDYAHNPHKIEACLAALTSRAQRVFVVFQPHGYGPTKFLLRDMARAFSSGLRSGDCLLCLPVFDAGGTADRTVSSEDLMEKTAGPRTVCLNVRDDAVEFLKEHAREGDCITVMGARDDTLHDLALQVLDVL